MNATPHTLLLTGGRVHTPDDPEATAMAVRDGAVLWVGSHQVAGSLFPDAEPIQLDGALVTPAFVDSHVHASATGLLLTGLDLTGCDSRQACLDAVSRFAAGTDAPVLWGHGWDESAWPDRRPPQRAELDTAAGGRPLYLSRVDVHSALVSSPLASLAMGQTGHHPDGPLTQQAHHTVRQAALAGLTTAQRRAAQQAFLRHAAAHGIATVHECAGPEISGVDDLHDLLASAAGPDVVGYWGELATDAEHARHLLTVTGAHGLAGDLFCDGALGSRTAALCQPYHDATHTSGVTYLDPTQIAEHVLACTQAGVQAGFHVIGDGATATVLHGLQLATQRTGVAALAQRQHRLEHLEMIDATQAATLAQLGVHASMQPRFDALWGGSDGMYAQRLGAQRALRLNPFAMLAQAGVALAFSSDTPVTAVDPWGGVRAAVAHRTPASRLPAAAAFAAHTSGGHRAAAGSHPLAGVLTAGAPASYAVWDTADLGSAVGATSGPRCLRTVARGRTIFTVEGALRP